MDDRLIKPYHLIEELILLFDLEGNMDTVLSASMYFLSQLMESERSSVFIYQPWRRELAVFVSLDLQKNEIRIPKSFGVAGWVFEHRQPVIVNNAYADSRFFQGVDDMTGFQTRNMICAPLIDNKNRCLGTLQSLNKERGHFTNDDLEMLDSIARMVAVAINNNRQYDENIVTNQARRKFINQIIGDIGNRDFMADQTALR